MYENKRTPGNLGIRNNTPNPQPFSDVKSSGWFFPFLGGRQQGNRSTGKLKRCQAAPAGTPPCSPRGFSLYWGALWPCPTTGWGAATSCPSPLNLCSRGLAPGWERPPSARSLVAPSSLRTPPRDGGRHARLPAANPWDKGAAAVRGRARGR